MDTQRIHIVNGDSTKTLLTEAGLQEPIVVWREMLCEGPSIPDVGSQDFWELRAKYVSNYTRETPILSYWDKVVEEIQQIPGLLTSRSQVVLWFEQDLFCQINLIACLTYLNKFLDNHQIELIYPPLKEDGTPQGLGYYSPEKILDLLDQKTLVNEEELLVARVLWHLWTQRRAPEMVDLLEEKTDYFPYLETGLSCHIILRIPDEDGYSAIHKMMLAKKLDPTATKKSIIRDCLTNKAFEWLGLGDLQYEKMLEELE